MPSPRRTTRGRRTIAVSVLTAGAVAVGGSASMIATATAAPAPTPRDVLPADPLTPLGAVLALVAQLTDAIDPLLVGLQSFDTAAVLRTLTDGQLGQLLTGLTGLQLGQVLDGSVLGRALAAVTTLTSPQLLELLATAADALRDTLPPPVGVTLKTLVDVVAGVLGERGVELPPQLASLLDLPAQVAPPAAAPAAAPVLRARIFAARPARDRRSVRVELTCPAVAETACRTVARATVAGRSAATARRVTVARGRTTAVRLRLSSTASRRLAERGGTVRVSVRTTGSTRGPVSSTVRVPALRR